MEAGSGHAARRATTRWTRSKVQLKHARVPVHFTNATSRNRERRISQNLDCAVVIFVFATIRLKRWRDILEPGKRSRGIVMNKVIVFVTYESPWFLAGGIAAVMAKLPLATAVASKLSTVVVTPRHRKSKKIAALQKQQIEEINVPVNGRNEVVSVLHSKVDCDWYFLEPHDGPTPSTSPFFDGKEHPYGVSKETLLRDSLFFGAAVVQALPAIAAHLGLISEQIEWNLVTQDWEGATAALAFASQTSCRGRLHLTLHNSYDEYASELGLLSVGIDPQRCPGDTILHRALGLIEQPAFTVSEQFADDFVDDMLQRAVMAPHLQPLLLRNPVVGVDNGPFKILAVDEPLLSAAASGDFVGLRAWKLANRGVALAALADHVSTEEQPVWGDKTLFRRDDAPWFVMAGRDDPRQKGYDVAAAAVEDYLLENHGRAGCAQFLFFPIPGDEGRTGLEFLRALAFRFPEDVLAFPFIWVAGFRAALQGATYGLMPSLYEPFGMANEFYLDGGCVGIGRATGGNLEQIVPLRGGSSFSLAVRVRADRFHSMSSQPTGLLFRESDDVASAPADWAAINRADYGVRGESRVNQRRQFPLFRDIVDELRVAIEDGIRVYCDQPALYYRMLAEGVAHIQRTFSWRRAGQEYARKVGGCASISAPHTALPKAGDGPGRVQWTDERPDGLFLTVADWTGMKWEFSERSSWETRWYPVPANPSLVDRADQLRRSAC
jgi:glycogen synthase